LFLRKKRNNLLIGEVFGGFLSRRRRIRGRNISWNNRLNWVGRELRIESREQADVEARESRE
jgi:hypothetical protein